MNSNELGKKDSKEALQDTILVKNEDIEKDTLKSKSSISQAQTCSNTHRFETVCQLTSFLDKTDSKTKIKIKILDFESFKQLLPFVSRYTSKFEVFKYQTDFEVISINNQICKDTETKTFKESFQNWLKNQKIDSKIIEILQKETE